MTTVHFGSTFPYLMAIVVAFRVIPMFIACHKTGLIDKKQATSYFLISNIFSKRPKSFLRLLIKDFFVHHLSSSCLHVK